MGGSGMIRDGAPAPVVVELTAERTYPLRRQVLRGGTPTTDVRFDGDDLPGTVHLGIAHGDTLVAISTWIDRDHTRHPGRAGVQLRGMATAPAARGLGHGQLLLSTGVARACHRGAQLVWARARATALGFYLHRGFHPIGAEYVDATTALAHRDVIRFLTGR